MKLKHCRSHLKKDFKAINIPVKFPLLQQTRKIISGMLTLLRLLLHPHLNLYERQEQNLIVKFVELSSHTLLPVTTSEKNWIARDAVCTSKQLMPKGLTKMLLVITFTNFDRLWRAKQWADIYLVRNLVEIFLKICFAPQIFRASDR